MIIKSENFHMILWDWDGLCLWQVQTNYNENTWEYPTILVWEEFLIEIAKFAVDLAERNLKSK